MFSACAFESNETSPDYWEPTMSHLVPAAPNRSAEAVGPPSPGSPSTTGSPERTGVSTFAGRTHGNFVDLIENVDNLRGNITNVHISSELVIIRFAKVAARQTNILSECFE